MKQVLSETAQSLEGIVAAIQVEGFLASVGSDGIITIMERAGLNFPQVGYLNIAPYRVEGKAWTLTSATPKYNDTVQLLAGVLSEAYGANVECVLKPGEPVTAR